jgi:A/G-specific adenine glycosylase
VAERAGKFSADPAETAALPGIGRSTAAAISVFAFGRRAAILDGNVKRVLGAASGSRASSPAQHERALWALAETLLPENDIEAYTQGMMDLGATVCRRYASLPATLVRCRLSASPAGRAVRPNCPGRRPRKALPERASSVLLLSDGRPRAPRTPPAEWYLGWFAELARSGRRVGRKLCPTPGLPAAGHTGAAADQACVHPFSADPPPYCAARSR